MKSSWKVTRNPTSSVVHPRIREVRHIQSSTMFNYCLCKATFDKLFAKKTWDSLLLRFDMIHTTRIASEFEVSKTKYPVNLRFGQYKMLLADICLGFLANIGPGRHWYHLKVPKLQHKRVQIREGHTKSIFGLTWFIGANQ